MAGLSRQQLAAVVWLRWRLLLSTFRRKGGTGEIVARFILYPVIFCFALGPATGAGFASYYAVRNGTLWWLSASLWIIFFVWHLVGLSTSTAAPSFDLSTLTRFPIRFRDYLIVRLSFGLLDVPTLIGSLCLMAMTIGIGAADPALLPWTAFVLFTFAVCNVLFSRMLYSWLDKWLAQRRAREIVAGFFILVSVGFQALNPILGHIGRHGRRISPAVMHVGRRLIKAGELLPPGLAGSAISHGHQPAALSALGAFAALLLYTVAFLVVLNVRLRSQYLGENLSEAPAARGLKRNACVGTKPASTGHVEALATLLPPVVMACLFKEFKYLLRSGPVFYSLIMPVLMVFLFGSRIYGMGGPGGGMSGLVFPSACAYLLLFLVVLLYNSFGADGRGVQLYFVAPVRIRDVVLAKNALSSAVCVVEVALIYAAVCLTAQRPSADLTALTLAWLMFGFLVSLTFGNLRSLLSPRKIEETGVRSMQLSGLNSLISFGVLTVPYALGGIALALTRRYSVQGAGYWIAAGCFAVLVAFALAGYVAVLGRVDEIAALHRQDLAAELCRT